MSCAFIEIWCTREVWRALKKLELLSAMPQVTHMHLSCSPNFPRASYLDERMLTYEPIVNEQSCEAESLIQIKLRIIFQIKLNPCFSPKINVRRLVFLSKFLYIKVVNYGIKWQFLLFFKHHPYSVKPVLSGHPTTPCGWLLNTVWTVLFCFLIKIFKGFVFLSGKVQSAADAWWERMHYWMWRNRFKKPTFITIRTSSACKY